MAIRKGHKVNVRANVNTTRSDSIFLDLKEDTTRRLRFLPPSREDGALFTKVVNHFKLKTDDTPPRGLALACNDHFHDAPCYLCELSRTLKRSKDKSEKQIGDDIRPSPRFYAAVLVAEKNDDGQWEYTGPKLIGLPKTAVDDINATLIQQDVAGDDFFCDADKGQDMMITRTGKGWNTKYNVMLTGMKQPLDEACPDWEERFIDNLEEKLNLKFENNADQREAAIRTFGDDLDWDVLDAEITL